MKKILCVIACVLFACSFATAQVEKVFVELYYVSDANDATDTTGGFLPVGSKTYRVYVDLAPGCKLRKVYGDANHPLKFSSTADFFNNKIDGQTFAKDISKNRYDENTVALDTWLTLGQTTKSAAITHFGVPKIQDTDGSFIGGANNDGGSAAVAAGLLSNNDVALGIPLATADGMDTMLTVPSSWGDNGFIDFSTETDSTIFGSLIAGSQFYSYDAMLLNSGVTGVNPDSNQILVAQLTTMGDISFELNVEVEHPNGDLVKYVANDSVLLTDELLNANLKYPPMCGCKDPNYLEYDPNFGCNVQDSCKTLIVFGCADPKACNYNPDVNFNLPDLCCYVGDCNDLDISVVCPTLSVENISDQYSFDVFPNPTERFLTLKSNVTGNVRGQYEVLNVLGQTVVREVDVTSESQQIDVLQLPAGIYVIRLSADKSSSSRYFVKN